MPSHVSECPILKGVWKEIRNTKKTMSIINFSNVQWNAEVIFGF